MEEGTARAGDRVRIKTDADEAWMRGLEGEVVSCSEMAAYVRFGGRPLPRRVPAKDVLVIEGRGKRRQRVATGREERGGDAERSEPRIVQLLPADGWCAVVADWREEPVGVEWAPLVAWALVERGSRQSVEGLLPSGGEGIVYLERYRPKASFLQYSHRSEDTLDNRQRLANMARLHRAYERLRRAEEGEEG